MKGKEVQHSIHQVIPVASFDDLSSDTHFVDALHFSLKQFKSTKRRSHTNAPINIFIQDILHPSDPRAHNKESERAKEKEIEGLIRRGTWKVVTKEDVPAGANVLNGRFAVNIKKVGTDTSIHKAPFVVQGHKEKEKRQLVHNSTTVRQSSTSLLIALAAIFGFRVWTHDITQAYLQSAIQLLRDVYLKPSKELELGSHQLLKLLKPLYGLADSGDYWNVTMAKHVQADLGMNETAGDMSLFFKNVREKLCGLIGTYVADSLLSGDEAFLKHTDKTIEKFGSKGRDMDNTRFAGVYIETKQNGFVVNQKSYSERLSRLNADCIFADFRSARAQLAWLIHTRPSIACDISMAAQVTESSFVEKHINALNKVIKNVELDSSRGLKMQKLDVNTLHIRAYADSSFANNEDHTSQLGYIEFLSDESGKFNVLHYAS